MLDLSTSPAIAPASWFPPPIGTLSELNAPATAGSTDIDSSRRSDLGDLATEDGAYGSGSESCGSNSFPSHFMCAIINADETIANCENGGNGPGPPNGGIPNGGPPNGGPTNGGNGASVNNGGAVEPPTMVNEHTSERVVIKLNDLEWACYREAL